MDDIRKINRFKEIPDNGLMADMLWSDPTKVLFFVHIILVKWEISK